jgi:hypothetical protein
MSGIKYTAQCLKEIRWGGKTYIQGDPIVVKREDIDLLMQAGVIGNIRRIEVETATVKAPENAARQYAKAKRGPSKGSKNK